MLLLMKILNMIIPMQNKKPEINPYVASSKDIQSAVGNIGGILSVNDLISGEVSPTIIPYFQPHIYPHNNTGICIGHNIDPI